MKNIFKLIGITVIVAVIGFSMTACNNDDDTDDKGGDVVNPDNGGVTGSTPTVTSVTVSPSTASVVRGATQQFSATVTGTNNPAQTVTWIVTGGVSGTSISTSGLLTVSSAEAAATLTVRATSTADTSKSGVAAVTVTAGGGGGSVGGGGGGSSTSDTTAPSLTAGSVARETDILAKITFTTNEAGTAFYKVVNKDGTAPTSIGSGTSLGPVNKGVNSGLSVTLSRGAKDIYVVVKDTAGNVSSPLKIAAAVAGWSVQASYHGFTGSIANDKVHGLPFMDNFDDSTSSATVTKAQLENASVVSGTYRVVNFLFFVKVNKLFVPSVGGSSGEYDFDEVKLSVTSKTSSTINIVMLDDDSYSRDGGGWVWVDEDEGYTYFRVGGITIDRRSVSGNVDDWAAVYNTNWAGVEMNLEFLNDDSSVYGPEDVIKWPYLTITD